ncbi:MAG TPA: CusA/CzcA family heavy metal efflux RND transporter [Candidatus Dormibacteraeota bacterium]|jgi:cobalt-zinc-cadmium resistance protein CzcA|nr:CusA/CzcA family heavy metal efflux RND transporter [Candidatus Dormibacteraeota bacterium]
MIHRIVHFALRQRFVILMITVLIVFAGAYSFRQMPVDAYPDLSPPMVELITQWPGHAAEEVERLTTLPLEIAMNGAPHLKVMRSISLYGLSDVRLTFDESVDPYFARQVIFERIGDASLPQGVTPSMAPLFSPSGLVYRYVLESPDRSPMELHTFEDWIISRSYRSVPGVADDSGFGGPTMEYHVLLDPVKLYNFHLPVIQVLNALQANNANTGGGFFTQGGQFYYVRGLGLIKSTDDVGEVVVGSNNGAPIRVKDIGHVEIGHAPRLGIFGFQDTKKNNDDAVEGVILMRRGEQTQTVLEGVEKKTEEINKSLLPPDVKVRPYYDRSNLVQVTTDTVEWNLIRGMILVLVVLIFFLVSIRAAVITALTIPLALLFAFIFLHQTGEAANLLSIGAIDFGIIIDGTIVMVENIYRELSERHGQEYKLHEVILTAARDVDRPIFYSVAVIIAGYLPIYALTGPAGKLFHPMADTMAFALIGALILTLTFVPVLASYWFKSGVKEKENRVFNWIRDSYAGRLDWCLNHPKTTVIVSVLIFGATLLLVPLIGGEFLPHLDEGALWVRATMPYTISFEDSSKFAPQIRDLLVKYPMVTVVGSELGRPDDGTDPTGFFNCEFYVGLKPYDDASWKKTSIHNKEELTRDLEKKLDAYPGVIFNFTQPAEDAVDEALTGLKSALAVKIFGSDLGTLEKKAVEIRNVLDKTPGFTELTVVRELGQPSLIIDADRAKIARYGINVSDVQAVISAAVGGQAATQVIQGEKLFDLVVRMEPQYRSSAKQIGDLLVPAPGGQQIPLSELCDIREASGASFIYRENNSRYIGIQFSVTGRDLEGIVNAGQRAVAKNVQLPEGYRLDWGGEYSELLEAKSQLYVIGPLAILLIFLILFALYGNFKFPVTIALGVVLTEPVGALIALKLTHTPLSVSSGLGLLALLGVSVETAVILVSYINKLRKEGKSIHEATREASLLRLRPIMMTALVACLGLLPAAMSTGVGSDTQKPFAIVVVAGLLSRLFLGFFVNPVLYEVVARDGDVLQV